MPKSSVPKPGPAKLSSNAGLDEWLAEAEAAGERRWETVVVTRPGDTV